MSGRLGIRGAEWPQIVAIALAVAIPTALAPVYAVLAAGLLLILAAVVFNAGALLALMVAAFPWDDMLGFPTETVSIIKILGALLMIGYVLRALSRDEDVRLPVTLPALIAFVMLVLLSLMLSGDVESGLSKTLRYLLFGAFTFLFIQLVRSRAELVTILRVLVALVDVRVAVRARPLHHGQRRTRLRADRRGQRLRLRARLRAAVRDLPDVARQARAGALGAVLGGAGPGLVRDALARRARRRRRGRAVGGRDPADALRRRARRHDRRGRDAAAGVHALAAADRRAARGQERRGAGQRRLARGLLVGRGADGRRSPDPRRRAGTLRDREQATTSSTTRSTSTGPSCTTPTSRCSPRAACRR